MTSIKHAGEDTWKEISWYRKRIEDAGTKEVGREI